MPSLRYCFHCWYCVCCPVLRLWIWSLELAGCIAHIASLCPFPHFRTQANWSAPFDFLIPLPFLSNRFVLHLLHLLLSYFAAFTTCTSRFSTTFTAFTATGSFFDRSVLASSSALVVTPRSVSSHTSRPEPSYDDCSLPLDFLSLSVRPVVYCLCCIYCGPTFTSYFCTAFAAVLAWSRLSSKTRP
jgi:hypothetical protein